MLLGGADRNWRVIYTDGRPQGQADEVVRGYYGNSVGKWDKDTLVVDVVGFNEHFWFASSSGLHFRSPTFDRTLHQAGSQYIEIRSDCG